MAPVSRDGSDAFVVFIFPEAPQGQVAKTLSVEQVHQVQTLDHFAGLGLEFNHGIADDVRRRILQAADGNPLFIEEMLALGWIDRLSPKNAVLTHMHIPLDYDTVMRETPSNVVPGFDGMVIEVPAPTN